MQKTGIIKDIITAVILTALSLFVYFWLIPNYVDDVRMTGMSPQFFPKFGAMMIAVCSICMFVLNVLKLTRLSSHHADSNTNDPSSEKVDNTDSALIKTDTRNSLFLPALVTLAFVAFVLAFEYVGFLLAAPLLVVILVLVFQGKKPLAIILTPLISSAILFLLFNYLLKVPLI